MSNFEIQPTSIAQWHSLVLEAEKNSGVFLGEELQSYLIITLDSFLTNEQLSSSIIALDFFDSLQQHGREGCQQLRTIGDQCLLLAGLFPESAYRKNVKPSYFIQIGEEAYRVIAIKYTSKQSEQSLFFRLSTDFVEITDVLNSMRD